MREAEGNLWEYHAHASPVCVPTNGSVNSRGLAVMGRGVAHQAAAKFPGLREALAARLRKDGNHVWWLVRFGLFSFPVKHNWRQNADLKLIERSCIELMEHIERMQFGRVVMPRVGCGNGGLTWEEVRPILTKHLSDDVVVLTLPTEGALAPKGE